MHVRISQACAAFVAATWTTETKRSRGFPLDFTTIIIVVVKYIVVV